MNKKLKTNPPTRRSRVFLVDEHILMRNAAASWINYCSELEVCGMTGGMADAFQAIEELRPDVVVTELMQLRDLGFIRELHQRHPSLPILVFSIHDEVVYGMRAREAGADGYLSKDATGDELVQTICDVVQRRRNRPVATARLAVLPRPLDQEMRGVKSAAAWPEDSGKVKVPGL